MGGQVINSSGSAYQHSIGLNLRYTLFDSGIRRMRYANAKRDLALSTVSVRGAEGEVKFEVLRLYARGLSLEKRITVRTRLREHRREQFALARRLYTAGRVDRLEVAESAIELADTARRLDDEKLEFHELLTDLSFYTGEEYDPDEVSFEEIRPPGTEAEFPDIADLPEIVAMDYHIEKKQVEYEMIRRERLPTISLYSSYRVYGRDPSSVGSSFRDLGSRNVSAGIVVDLKLFEGFAGRAREGRARQEIVRLQRIRDKRIAELERQVATLAVRSNHYSAAAATWRDHGDAVHARMDMVLELGEQELVDRIFILEQMVEQAEAALDIELKQVEQAVTARHLSYLAEAEVQ